MSIRDSIATDVVVSPFGADAGELTDVARCIESAGFDGFGTFDHFSGSMVSRAWSRELFTILGAAAATTERMRVGPLVANMVNRHPVMLASAMSTLQSLSGGRAFLGLGGGAAPGSRFAAEHSGIGRRLLPGPDRLRYLGETIEVVRLVWSGGGSFEGEFFTLDDVSAVVGPEEVVPIIVGAGGLSTAEFACGHADGVNLLAWSATPELAERTLEMAPARPFEISIHDDADLGHPLGGDVARLVELGVSRRTIAIAAPFDLEALELIGMRLNE